MDTVGTTAPTPTKMEAKAGEPQCASHKRQLWNIDKSRFDWHRYCFADRPRLRLAALVGLVIIVLAVMILSIVFTAEYYTAYYATGAWIISKASNKTAAAQSNASVHALARHSLSGSCEGYMESCAQFNRPASCFPFSPSPVPSLYRPARAHGPETEYLLCRRHGLLRNRPQPLRHLLLRELVRLRSRPPQGGSLFAWDYAMWCRARGRLLRQCHGLFARWLPDRPAAAFGDRRLVDAGRHGDIGSDRQRDKQTRRSGSSERRCSLACYAVRRHSCRFGCSVGGGRPSVSAEKKNARRQDCIMCRSFIEWNAEGPR